MKKIVFLLSCLFISISLYSQVANKATEVCPLLIGTKVPDAELVDPDGQKHSLSDIVKQKPTVLIFYRGGWCPFCNAHLSGLGSIQQDILDSGYQLIAISPDHYANLKNTLIEDSISYQIFSDPSGSLISDMGIGYKTPLKIKGYLVTKKREGKTSAIMPVPSVFVLNDDGEILFEYVNPDYKQRLSGEMLLAVLRSL